MVQDLTDRLHERHPKFFVQDTPAYEEIQCGDGWFDLIDACLSMIENAPGGDDFRAFQIKEKFGELRVYSVGPTTPQVDAIISHAVCLSRETCMECGGPGKIVSTGGYVHCACPPCHESVKKRMKR